MWFSGSPPALGGMETQRESSNCVSRNKCGLVSSPGSTGEAHAHGQTDIPGETQWAIKQNQKVWLQEGDPREEGGRPGWERWGEVGSNQKASYLYMKLSNDKSYRVRKEQMSGIEKRNLHIYGMIFRSKKVLIRVLITFILPVKTIKFYCSWLCHSQILKRYLPLSPYH